MARTILAAATTQNSVQLLSTTTYNAASSARYTATFAEAEVNITMRGAGTASRMVANIGTNTTTTASTTFRSRKNGGAGNMVVVFSAGTTGISQDTTNTDTIAAGDTYDFETTVDAGGSGNQYSKYVAVVFNAFSDTRQVIGVAGSSGTAANSASRACVVAGDWDISQTSAVPMQCKMKGGTLSNARVSVTAARTTDSGARVLVNSANANNNIVCTADTTGWFEDSSNTDVLATDDTVSWKATTAATGSNTFTIICAAFDYTTTNNKSEFICGKATGIALAASTSYWMPPYGYLHSNATTEAHAQMRISIQGTVTNLRTYVSANATTNTSTMTLRKNSADARNTLSISSAATGWFEDSTNFDQISPGDDIDTAIVVAAGGTLTLRNLTMTFQANGTPKLVSFY